MNSTTVTPTITTPPWVTVQQAADHARVHHCTIRRAIQAGDLPASRVGWVIRIALQDLETWLRSKPVRARGEVKP